MVRNLRNILLLLSLAVAVQTGFAQQLYMQVEIRRPAVIRVASDVQRLLLVNNAKLGTNGVRECLFAATQALEDGERFADVSVLPERFEGNCDSLIERYEVDALLLLDALVIDDLTGAEQMEDGTWDAWFETHNLSRWTIYYRNASAVSYTTSDTLLWEQNAVSKERALAALPDRSETLLDVAAYVGEQIGLKLTPEWVTEDRYFYRNDDPSLAAGFEAVQRRDWTAAADRWTEAYSGQGRAKETAAYAAADVAVAMEMQDRYDEAVAWTRKAIATFRKLSSADAAQQVVNLQYYLKQLQLRQAYVF